IDTRNIYTIENTEYKSYGSQLCLLRWSVFNNTLWSLSGIFLSARRSLHILSCGYFAPVLPMSLILASLPSNSRASE
ncbi:hypothetical protein BD408DRAFT_470062, partial [Parasitella parasitica]